MVCIQKELNEMAIGDNALPQQNNNNGTADSSVDNPCPSRWVNGGGYGSSGKQMSFFGIFGCMRPFFSLMGKSNLMQKSNEASGKSDQWEIPFESITDLEWLGSGAQGTVFSGKLKNEIVAVKKVRDLKETDIKHLRKLDHENIIKFK